MAFSLRVSASFRFPLYGMHRVSATRPIGHESFFQASINPQICWHIKCTPVRRVPIPPRIAHAA
jgi:hypothetical protein